MEQQGSLGKRVSIELLKILLGVVLGLAGLAGLVFGVPAGINWSAEKKAGAFCESIKRGTDVTALAANFQKNAGEQHIVQYEAEDASSHTFLFEGFLLDRAACRVTMDGGHKAVSVHTIAAN